MSRRIAVGKVSFGVDLFGLPVDDPRPAVVLLHGFTGSAATWTSLAEVLRSDYRPIALELLGHGASDAPTDPDRYRVERAVLDVLALLDTLGIDRFALLGYSLGGRVALRLALTAPDRVSALVLESASPGIVDPVERVARVESDERLAGLLEAEGLEAFVDRWERVPLFSSQARLPADVRTRLRAQRLRCDPVGLANSLRGIGAGAAAPIVDDLHKLRMPTLVLAGALDDKYVALGEHIVAATLRARLVIVPDAGHAIHLERPDAFHAQVSNFLEEHIAVPMA